MIEQARVKGFVIGKDEKGGKSVWKIRVQNSGQEELDGKKFEVASTHDDIELAQGLDVSFVLGLIRERGGQVTKALDVKIDNGVQEQEEVEQAEVPKRDVLEDDKQEQEPKNESDTINLVALKSEGELTVVFTGIESEAEARKIFAEASEEVLAFIQIPIDTDGKRAVDALVIVSDSEDGCICYALEDMMTAILNAGVSIAAK